jgi:hypothetical protein
LRCAGLQRLIRQEWEHQRHFPLPIATKLSQQFAQHGLQFFKVNRTVTHVSVARPQFLDIENSPVSDGIKRIVQYINANPKCTRKKLIEALAPTPKSAPAPAPVSPPAPAAEAATTSAPAAAVAPDEPAPAAAPAAEPVAEKPAATSASPATPEQTEVMVDLHWLIHQGAVLEFADGHMETAKKPAPKPPKPEKQPAPAGETTATTEAAPAAGSHAGSQPQAEAPAVAETAPATGQAAGSEPAAASETPAPTAESVPTTEVPAAAEKPAAPASETPPTA